MKQHSLRKLVSLSLVLTVLLTTPLIQWLVIQLAAPRYPQPALTPEQMKAVEKKLQMNIQRIDKKLDSYMPRTGYMVINTTTNEFSLYRGNELLRRDKCSTGSYTLLKNGDQQQWMFKTPKGQFSILAKTKAPVWRKPDWAFVEVGLPVPPAGHPSRYEYGVLGDYSLSLGQGYLIHGTLYQRLLGMPVTHGCVRLNDENLELVYRTLNIGSKVFIY